MRRFPHARMSREQLLTPLSDAYSSAHTAGRLATFEALPEALNSSIFSLTTEIYKAVVGNGADPEAAANVAMDVICAEAGLFELGGNNGQ